MNKLVLTSKAARIIYLSAVAFLVFVSIYHFYYARRIIPGVVVGGVKVGGKTYSQAKNLLQKKDVETVKNLALKYKDTVFEIKQEEIGLEYDWDASLSRAFEVGRTGNIISDTKDKIAGLYKGLYIRAFYEYDKDLLTRELLTIKGEINRDAENASFILNNGQLEIAPSSTGVKINDKELYNLVITVFDKMDFKDQSLTAEEEFPKVIENELKEYLSSAQKVVLTPFKIVYKKSADPQNPILYPAKEKAWSLTPEQILDLVSTERNDKGELQVLLNKVNFEAYLSTLGQEVNEPPRGLVAAADGNKVTDFKLVKSGRELDTKAFTENFKTALFNSQNSVEVVMKEISEGSDASKYGIFALLGEGKSKFTGSASGRIHNLTLAAERINGVLVPPGGLFSFNQTVGEISGRTGYNAAYIISNGRTVLGEGGGVCQTSTTLFRAILNSGLPIVARYPHAYRVAYYEIESPVGFDASVYQPSLDLQFRNDTPNYILVQASWNLDDSSLSFKIYGTPDGRKVEISEPVVSNVIGAPAPLYQDDPTLPKGVVRQVDWSAAGANVYFTRTVTRDNEVLYKDTFSSRYQPWRAIFLVGTKI